MALLQKLAHHPTDQAVLLVNYISAHVDAYMLSDRMG